MHSLFAPLLLSVAAASSPEAWCQNIVGEELAAHAQNMDSESVGAVTEALCTEAARAGLDPLLVLALMHLESTYNPQALSSQGARGLLQLLPATAKGVARRQEMDSADCQDPANNVALGVRYLEELVHEFGSLEPALLAYNIGPPALHARLKGGHAQIHSAKFVLRVMHYYQGLQRQYPRPGRRS